MRLSKALCIALGALNIAVFLVSSVPRADTGLEARVRAVPKSEARGRAAGTSIAFRLAGEYPIAPAAAIPENALILVPEERVDDASISFLGSMTSPEGKAVFFFKDKATNRVYSSGGEGAGLTILSTSEKEFILEIDGKKYKVSR